MSFYAICAQTVFTLCEKLNSNNNFFKKVPDYCSITGKHVLNYYIQFTVLSLETPLHINNLELTSFLLPY